MGVFAFPHATEADWSDIFGDYGSYGYGYDYNAEQVIGQHTGEIRLSKRVRRVDHDQNYHETTVVRSGELVEVWIEVKNTSDVVATVAVSDQLGGSTVYKANSLRLDGQTTPAGLTSGNFFIEMDPDTVAIITYEIYVCGGSSSAIRANAYSPGIGSATDAVIIETEETVYSYSYSNYESTCMNQFYNPSSTAVGNSGTTLQNYSSGQSNIFGDWTGVNSANATNNTANNPFGDWTGVNNNDSGYDMRGYSSTPVAINNASNSNSSAGTRNVAAANSTPSNSTYFVSPTTGVSKNAPIWFAGLLSASFIIYKKRKLIFN